MSPFSSKRERNLWVALAVVVATIFATLGVAPSLLGHLREHGLLGEVFVASFLLVGVAVLTQGLRVRPGGFEALVFLAFAIAAAMLVVRMSIPEERTHLIEYGVVGLLVHEALVERRSNGRSVPLEPLLAIVLACAVGVTDELLQAVLPGRVFDARDVLFNALACAGTITAAATLAWVRRAVVGERAID